MCHVIGRIIHPRNGAAKTTTLKLMQKLVFVALVRWEIDVCQKVSICASEVLINTCDMIAVERMGQIQVIELANY